ncbi:hypothetical protein U1Q18_002775 [Sarracenia purpurea var. burkii]
MQNTKPPPVAADHNHHDPPPPPPSTHEFFLDRFVSSHESSSTANGGCNRKASDFPAYFSLHHLDYGPGTSLFPHPNSRSSEMNISDHDFHSGARTPPVFASMSNPFLTPTNNINPSSSSSISLLPSPNPSMGSFDHVNGVQGWNNGTFSNNGGGSTSNGSSDSIELQSQNSFFESAATAAGFSWGPAECVKSEKEVGIQALEEDDPEDIKWSEYLQTTPFLVGTSASVHNQTALPMFGGETKPEEQFTTEGGLGADWHHQNHHYDHHHQPQQSPPGGDSYSKLFRRLAAAYGGFS